MAVLNTSRRPEDSNPEPMVLETTALPLELERLTPVGVRGFGLAGYRETAPRFIDDSNAYQRFTRPPLCLLS